MAGKQLGIAQITVGSMLLDSEAGATIDIGGTVRTPVIGGNKVLGFSESIKEAVVECVISVGANTSLSDLRAIAGVTVHFACDTGQVYVITNACLAEPPKATAGEGGKVALKFFGDPAVELAGG